METPLKRTLFDWTIEILSFLGVVWSCVPLFFYKNLSEKALFPIHYNAMGKADGWGDRSDLWVLPVVASAFWVGLTLIERCYKRMNYPVKVTDENADTLHRLGVRLMRLVKLFVILTFCYLNNSAFAAAAGGDADLNNFIMYGLMGGLIGSMIVYWMKMVANR